MEISDKLSLIIHYYLFTLMTKKKQKITKRNENNILKRNIKIKSIMKMKFKDARSESFYNIWHIYYMQRFVECVEIIHRVELFRLIR